MNKLAKEIRDYIDANNDFLNDFPVAANLLSRAEEYLRLASIGRVEESAEKRKELERWQLKIIGFLQDLLENTNNCNDRIQDMTETREYIIHMQEQGKFLQKCYVNYLSNTAAPIDDGIVIPADGYGQHSHPDVFSN